MVIEVNSKYSKKVQLLIRVLPLIDTEHCFALKGGTAINLFYRDLPRLSVDIDLLYLPMENRESSLKNIREALSRISKLIEKTIQGSHVYNAYEQSDALRLFVTQGEVIIKVELSPVIRGCVFDAVRMEVCEEVEKVFGYAEIKVASFQDLYAGKLCAALDRQHPRDLFDVKLLLENEGLTNNLRKTFLIFLISHQRPMAELLAPNRKDISGIFETEFAKMTRLEVTLKELEATREKLVHLINTQMTENEKRFLLSFKSRNPDWSLMEMENTDLISNLPAVRWKMINLQQMTHQKHKQTFAKLQEILKITV